MVHNTRNKRGRGINGEGEEEEQEEEQAAVVPLLFRRRRTIADTKTAPSTLARVSSIVALRGRIRRHYSRAHVEPPRGLYLRKKKQPQSVNVSCDEIIRMFQMRVALEWRVGVLCDDLPRSLPGAVRCPTNAAPDRLLRSS